MKNLSNHIKSGYIAIVISLFALFCSCFNNVGSLFTGFIMSSFAILVTVLIGWQIIQYIFAKKTIEDTVNESSKTLISDFTHSMKALTLFQKAESLETLHSYTAAIDSLFAAIQELHQCNNQEVLQYMEHNVLSLLLQIFESGKDEQGYHVPTDKKQFYLSLLHNPSKHDIEARIIQILQEAADAPADYYQEYVYILAKKG